MKSARTGFFAVVLFTLFTAVAIVPAAEQSGGTIERIKVHGTSLEGNLEKDSPDRDVVVYLPPSYGKSPAKRYPVVYFLHGYGVNVDAYVKLLNLPKTADDVIAAGTKEMIIVLPDAHTVYNGSMYSNSPTTGNWEDFIARDLVAYIDSNYRTLAHRDSRGLSGHSMGGYGTIRIGMKHPEVFSALYAMSSCCLMNTVSLPPVSKEAPPKEAPAPATEGKPNPFAKVAQAQAAAWAPNPANPPDYFDLPTKDGEIQQFVVAKYAANSPLAMASQYVSSLKRYKAIVMDVGDKDFLRSMNVELHGELERLGVPHLFEEYEGDHGNRVASRFQNNVMSFFSRQLKFE